MKKIKSFFKFIILLLIVVAAVFIATGYKKYKTALDEMPLSIAVEEIRAEDNYTFIGEVPDIYIKAVISCEDRRFYLHNGFDIVGTLRAIIVDIKAKSLEEGGSTITQQLAKNMYFNMDNSAIRKIAEIFMAMEIERNYSKDEILELYFNGIYYGSGYYNLYDASVGYFGKKPSDMTVNEATLLAGVPNAPSVYSPKVNPELAKKRQEKILDCLVRDGHMTENEAEEILKKGYNK